MSDGRSYASVSTGGKVQECLNRSREGTGGGKLRECLNRRGAIRGSQQDGSYARLAAVAACVVCKYATSSCTDEKTDIIPTEPLARMLYVSLATSF